MKKSVVSKGNVLSSWWYFAFPVLLLGIIFVTFFVSDFFEKEAVPVEEAAVGEEAIIVEGEIVPEEEGMAAEEAEVSTGKTGVTSGGGGGSGGSGSGGGGSSGGDSTATTDEEAVSVTPSEEAVTEEEIMSLTIPSSLENNCIGFLAGGPSVLETISLIGAAWARPHPGPFSWGLIEITPGVYNFSATDKWVKTAQKNNVLLIATFFPYASWDQGNDSACMVSEEDEFYSKIPKYRCKPKDMEAYKNFLTILIERYDGDGVDDMPGLEIPVKYWEISNEPDLNSSTLTFFIGDEQDYFDLLKESYLTIKQACPDCMVLHGGAAGSQEIFLSFWGKVFALGGGEYFDIANVHSINGPEGSDYNVGVFASLLKEYSIDQPLWVTEVQFSSPDADVLTSTQKAFDAGAEKIIFTSFIVGVRGPFSFGEYSDVYRDAVALCLEVEEVAVTEEVAIEEAVDLGPLGEPCETRDDCGPYVCNEENVCGECQTPEECGEGFVCSALGLCSEVEEGLLCPSALPDCSDGVDNDKDSLVDRDDDDCSDWDSYEKSVQEEVLCPYALPDCADNVDNDKDGFVDREDLGCVGWDDEEVTQEVV